MAESKSSKPEPKKPELVVDDDDELDENEPTHADERALALVEAEEEAVEEWANLSNEERREAFYLQNQRSVSD